MSTNANIPVFNLLCYAGLTAASFGLFLHVIRRPPWISRIIQPAQNIPTPITPEPDIPDPATPEPTTPTLEILEPRSFARGPAPMVHASFEQADEYAEADALVNGDLITADGTRFYVAKKHRLQDGSSVFTYEPFYMFEEYL